MWPRTFVLWAGQTTWTHFFFNVPSVWMSLYEICHSFLFIQEKPCKVILNFECVFWNSRKCCHWKTAVTSSSVSCEHLLHSPRAAGDQDFLLWTTLSLSTLYQVWTTSVFASGPSKKQLVRTHLRFFVLIKHQLHLPEFKLLLIVVLKALQTKTFKFLWFYKY